MLRYRLTHIVKPKKLYLLYIIIYMHIVLFFRNVFHRQKNSFLITGIELKLCHCTTLKKHLRKTILPYVIITVSCETYLGIVQSMKRKFVSSAENTWKIDTDFMICSSFFAFSGLVQFHYHSRDNSVF